MSGSHAGGTPRSSTPEMRKVLMDSPVAPSTEDVVEPSRNEVNWLHLLYLGFVANVGHSIIYCLISLFTCSYSVARLLIYLLN